MEALEKRGCRASDLMVEQATWPLQRGLNWPSYRKSDVKRTVEFRKRFFRGRIYWDCICV